MASTEESELEALRTRAREAAGSAPVGGHLDDATLERLRRDPDADPDEGTEEAKALSHVASCAACRARMLATSDERARAAALVDAALAASMPAPRAGPVRSAAGPRPARNRTFQIGAAVALLAAAAALTLVVRSHDEPLVLSQRAVAGMMGGSPSAALPPEDMNVAISLPARGSEAAVLVVVDARGKRVTRAQWMAHVEDRLEGTIAPRALPIDRTPPLSALVLAGSKDATTRALAALDAAQERGAIVDAASAERAARAAGEEHRVRAARLEVASDAAGRIR